jgi:hypothetical protein
MVRELWMGKLQNTAVVVSFDVLSRYLKGGNEENHDDLRLAGVSSGFERDKGQSIYCLSCLARWNQSYGGRCTLCHGTRHRPVERLQSCQCFSLKQMVNVPTRWGLEVKLTLQLHFLGVSRLRLTIRGVAVLTCFLVFPSFLRHIMWWKTQV